MKDEPVSERVTLEVACVITLLKPDLGFVLHQRERERNLIHKHMLDIIAKPLIFLLQDFLLTRNENLLV